MLLVFSPVSVEALAPPGGLFGGRGAAVSAELRYYGDHTRAYNAAPD